MKQIAIWLLFAAATAAQPACAIRGTIIDAITKAPLTGAEVSAELRLPDDSALPVRRVTDTHGRFCFETLREGDYSVKAKRAFYLYTRYESRPGNSEYPVHVSPANISSPLSVAMLPEAVIDGAVLDNDGDLVPGAQITLLQSRLAAGKQKIERVQTVTTDDQGRFRFSELAAGTYFIAAVWNPEWPLFDSSKLPGEDGQLPARSQRGVYYANAKSFADATPIQLKTGQELSYITITAPGPFAATDMH